jgi:hypothetical protein
VESTIIAFSPPVSAISGAVGRQMVGHAAADRQGGFGRAGEGHAGHPRIAGQHRAHRAIAGQKLQRGRRARRPVQERHRKGGDQRRLLGRFGQHGIARGQRRRDLAGEDRQREVPRADAGEDARAGWSAMPRRRRNSAGNPPPRAVPTRHRPAVLPASRAKKRKIGPKSAS